MIETVVARVVALKTLPIAALKQQWRELFDREPPAFNRRYLESRLAYRIQELAYGGLKPDTIERLEALADEIEADAAKGRRRPAKSMPTIGTQLVREWQ